MKFNKPGHSRYVFRYLSNDAYSQYASAYSQCKKHGIRGIYAFVTGTGVANLVVDICKGKIVQYGKRRLAVLILACSTYISCPAISILTNSTRVLRMSKLVYTCVGYGFELCEDLSNVSFLPMDMALFGRPIASGQPGRFTTWTEITDVINNLPLIGDE